MICERLIGLVKNWYISVQEETMAPARMVAFMEKHIKDCQVCQGDNGLEEEFKKIRDIVLPASKIPKSSEDEQPEEEPVEEEETEEDDDDD